MAEGEDRISNLPDDLIHRILSFLDMKNAVETSLLSQRWKLIWTSLPYLNLSSGKFPSLPKFAKFVKHVVSHRNNRTEVSALSLDFKGAATQFFVKSIANYAFSHNIIRLTLSYSPERRHQLPLRFFNSNTLKHLTLKACLYGPCCTPKEAWDFPVLETLHLSCIRLSDETDKTLDLFCKCVKLKSLTLHRFFMAGQGIFNITAPQLSNIVITDGWRFPKVFNVVAPQLENLTVSACSTECVVSAPRLSSFSCKGSDLQLSTNGFHSLDKVNLDLSISKYDKVEDVVPILLDVLKKLCSAEFLTLSMDIVEALSSCADLLLREPCPFDNLKYLKIDTTRVKEHKDPNEAMPAYVRNYFLENSPSATFIMELPEVPPKKSRKQLREESKARKKVKLEEEQQHRIRMEAMAKEKAILEEEIRVQNEEWKSHAMGIVAELQVQVEGGKPDYAMVNKLCYIRAFLDIAKFLPKSDRVEVEAKYSSLHAEIKAMFLASESGQWVEIETMLEIIRSRKQSNSSNNHEQSDVPATVHPPELPPSGKDIPESFVASTSGSKADMQPIQNNLA